MTPNENLAKQYDDVIEYITAYYRYGNRVFSRYYQLPIRRPRAFLRITQRLPEAVRQFAPLSTKNSEFSKTVMLEIVSEGDKESEHYKHLFADYRLHSFSTSLEDRFSDVDFEKIRQLHELKRGAGSRFPFKRNAGIVLAVTTILLKSIPESVVTRIIDYKTFELTVFLLACATTIYLLLIVLPLWARFNEAKRVHSFARLALEYICIKRGRAQT
jgi:hypothetical protein